MTLGIPELSLVLLIGVSGSGKSSFARRHFLPTEVLSSDFFRGLVSDDENDQSATGPAFDALRYVAQKRLEAGKLTVVDATNVQPEARKAFLELARQQHVLVTGIVLDLPENLCIERNKARPDRDFGPHVVRRQSQQLRRSMRSLEREGIRTVHVLKGQDEIDAAVIERQRLYNNLKDNHGPFDIIGDIHGCSAELVELLERLGYVVDETGPQIAVSPPEGRTVVFLGDLVDRGPGVTAVLRLVMAMVRSGTALCVLGNHEVKLLRKLRGRNVQVTHGLQQSLDQLDAETPEFREEVARFIDGLISHYVLDDGRLVVAHAGLKAELQGRSSGRVREFALYGEATGETDEYGLPVRYDWAREYRGKALVVYGHTPTVEADFLNDTICIDTGCVFGGSLTALRYPERELVSVQAARVYYEPVRPLSSHATATEEELLDVTDLLGKRVIRTGFERNVTVQEGNAAAAFEIMNRFGVDPRWLIYLPPTMAPTHTSKRADYLEFPEDAFEYYRQQGVANVVCEEKHMGSRAVFVICRDEATARRRFGSEDSLGVCFTRTGRRFFSDAGWERAVLERVAAALEAAGIWDELGTNWVCLDAEVMPWSLKGRELIERQYAPAGTAARASMPASVEALTLAVDRVPELSQLLQRHRSRDEMTEKYVVSYQRYARPAGSLDDVRIAPFHLLAGDNAVHTDKPHTWHMAMAHRICEAGGSMFTPTPYREVSLDDASSCTEAIDWWLELTEAGGEGMVVKPREFLVKGRHGLVQPAVKCRGREYLRIIYGPEYTAPENLERLRQRSVNRKSGLAMSEFMLGVEALRRFVAGEPLYRVAECSLGVLALESEPVDPRL